jgi:hypothetical protein
MQTLAGLLAFVTPLVLPAFAVNILGGKPFDSIQLRDSP